MLIYVCRPSQQTHSDIQHAQSWTQPLHYTVTCQVHAAFLFLNLPTEGMKARTRDSEALPRNKTHHWWHQPIWYTVSERMVVAEGMNRWIPVLYAHMEVISAHVWVSYQWSEWKSNLHLWKRVHDQLRAQWFIPLGKMFKGKQYYASLHTECTLNERVQ